MMKIGVFASKHRISIYTIRFYIKEGLLLPEKKNNQYYFDESCEEDMILIKELRECMFSLKEISKILSVKRISRFQEEQSVTYLVDTMHRKEKELYMQRDKLTSIIRRVQKKAEDFSAMQPPQLKAKGISIGFCEKLCCPICKKALTFTNMSIEGTLITEGRSACRCGYKITMEEGVMLTASIDRDMEVWYTIDALICSFSQEYLQSLFRVYSWMLDQLAEKEIQNKVILCNGENGAEFLYQYLPKLGTTNKYIITDVSPMTVTLTKRRLEYFKEDYDILYIACAPHEIPLRQGSVDILIDDGSSFYDMFDSNDFFIEKVHNVLKKDAFIVGFYSYYDSNAVSLQNIKRLFPGANIGNMGIRQFKRNLREKGYVLAREQEIGSVHEPGDWAKFHDSKEEMHMMAYVASKPSHKAFYTFHT